MMVLQIIQLFGVYDMMFPFIFGEHCCSLVLFLASMIVTYIVIPMLAVIMILCNWSVVAQGNAHSTWILVYGILSLYPFMACCSSCWSGGDEYFMEKMFSKKPRVPLYE